MFEKVFCGAHGPFGPSAELPFVRYELPHPINAKKSRLERTKAQKKEPIRIFFFFLTSFLSFVTKNAIFIVIFIEMIKTTLYTSMIMQTQIVMDLAFL